MYVNRRYLLLSSAFAPLIIAIVIYYSANGSQGSLRSAVQLGVGLTEYIQDHEAKAPALGVKGFNVSNEMITIPVGQPGAFYSQVIAPDKQLNLEFLPTLDYIRFVAQRLLQGTKFQGKFAINESPDEGRINLYFLDDDPRGIIPAFKHISCLYVGYYNAIVCRNKFFEDYARHVDATKIVYDLIAIQVQNRVTEGQSSRSNLDVAKNILKQGMLTWVIGHEIGHAVLHRYIIDKTGRSLHSAGGNDQVEHEADNFFATKFGADRALQGTPVAAALGEFVEQQFRDEYLSENPGPESERIARTRFFPTLAAVTITATPYDIPLLMRALNIKKEIIKQHVFVDDTGYYDIVSENIKIAHWLGERGSRLVVTMAAGFLGGIGLLWLLFSKGAAK